MGPTRGRWALHRRIDPARAIAIAIVVAGVGLALVRMIRIAGESSRVQYTDYWPMLDSLLAHDGGIRWRGLVEVRNEHPIAIPKVLYLLNVGLTDGDNHGQAAIVFALALTLVAMVGLLVRGTPGMGRATRVAMVVMAAFVVLAPQGAWSYTKAMSGTAWLTANVFVVAAIVAQQRDRRWLPLALGLLACVSYGTGLAVWPALAVAGLLRHGRHWREQWTVWATGTAVGALYLGWYLTRRDPGPRAESNPLAIVESGAELVLGAFASGDAAVALGLATAAATGAALWACRDRLSVAAPWVALVVFAGASALLIGRSRTGAGIGPVTFAAGLASRYWTIVAWAWIGLAGLAVVALRDRPWRVAVPVVLLLVVGSGGGDVPAQLRSAHENQELLAVGMHLGLADDNHIGGGIGPLPAITDRLREIDHAPFDQPLTMGCGLLGETVEVEPHLPAGVEGEIRSRALGRSTDVRGFSGTLDTPDGHLECVVVVDAAGTVVGTGPTPSWDDPHRFALRALAPTQYLLTVAVRLEPDGPLYAVPKVEG